MISQYGLIYESAKAVTYFRGLSHVQQKELTVHYKELAAQEKEAEKQRKRLEDKSQANSTMRLWNIFVLATTGLF
jgi:hypothetical protein